MHVCLDINNLALSITKFDTAQTRGDQLQAKALYDAQKGRWEYKRRTGVEINYATKPGYYRYTDDPYNSTKGKIKAEKVKKIENKIN